MVDDKDIPNSYIFYFIAVIVIVGLLLLGGVLFGFAELETNDESCTCEGSFDAIAREEPRIPRQSYAFQIGTGKRGCVEQISRRRETPPSDPMSRPKVLRRDSLRLANLVRSPA
jgi:hypothetical protein